MKLVYIFGCMIFIILAVSSHNKQTSKLYDNTDRDVEDQLRALLAEIEDNDPAADPSADNVNNHKLQDELIDDDEDDLKRLRAILEHNYEAEIGKRGWAWYQRMKTVSRRAPSGKVRRIGLFLKRLHLTYPT